MRIFWGLLVASEVFVGLVGNTNHMNNVVFCGRAYFQIPEMNLRKIERLGEFTCRNLILMIQPVDRVQHIDHPRKKREGLDQIMV